ncbi:hypothetical protein [Natronobacterium gregoryi]|uniref:Uncharacterized protein n=2 Tax=Natronobacterium gregoryi TaxID=44930 RepID=L0AE44_NATGS|nr:hypothetical protein [Natronobacterium gregoryi]AFZ71422.1 hypothetical protein Natgr_0158 [Natronobacterium gregoryi SP2]ELY66947.1 hypothetical protein C490_11943 [Natronobacterium gregoryi SP2]PLK21198.1 hypothetical protein CYV19_05105 [Natronobacterium gregoryi SP2]SFI84200.1 hypothetical protein SAMN05443661_10711 [Natronobacterium gregoryi]
MGTIITRRVNGSGPYAYRVEYSDGSHHWEYLGPVGKVDPDDLEDHEVAQLRDEGFGLARFRNTQRHEFADRDVANAIRDQLDDDELAPTDDRREATIVLAEDASLSTQTLVSGKAADSRADAGGYGQEPLTDSERNRIDFTKTNVMHARAAKAAIQDEGIDDWMAIYDHRLEPEEHVNLAQRNRESIQGERLDEDDTDAAEDERIAVLEQAESQAEQRAREACEEGHEEACDELRNMGWSDDEIRELEQYADAQDFARVVVDEKATAAN